MWRRKRSRKSDGSAEFDKGFVDTLKRLERKAVETLSPIEQHITHAIQAVLGGGRMLC